MEMLPSQAAFLPKVLFQKTPETLSIRVDASRSWHYKRAPPGAETKDPSLQSGTHIWGHLSLGGRPKVCPSSSGRQAHWGALCVSLRVPEILLLQHYDVMLAPAPNDIMLAPMSCTLGDMRKLELHDVAIRLMISVCHKPVLQKCTYETRLRVVRLMHEAS